MRQPLRLALAIEPTGNVRVRLSEPEGSHASLGVLDRSDRLVARIAVPESDEPITWRPVEREGRRLAAGTYLVVLRDHEERLARKLILK